MRIYIIDSSTKNKQGSSGSDGNFTSGAIAAMREIMDVVESPDEADKIISMAVSDAYWDEFEELFEKFHSTKDFYTLVWDCQADLDIISYYHKPFRLFIDYPGKINAIVPNMGVKFVLKTWFPDLKVNTFRTFAQYFDTENIEDKDYVVISGRDYLHDPSSSWAQWACKRLHIPFVHLHYNAVDYQYEDYKKVISNCSFLINTIFEASTGGMALLEGYYHGKPVLITDSPMNGANDIFGDRAIKFIHNDARHLVQTLKEAWETRPSLNINEARKFCKENNSPESFARQIKSILEG